MALSPYYAKIILFYMKEIGHITLSFLKWYLRINLNDFITLNLSKEDKVET